MHVFLTGGSGLVGSHVAHQLRDAGHDVRALVRADSAAAFLARIGCELVTGDLADPVETQARRIEGCDALVHAAALVGARASRDEYVARNVAGTRSILAGAAAAGVDRALHVSSVAVYGGIAGRITEERWQEVAIHTRASYAWSKRAAELEAWRHDGEHGMRVTTVRPALVYGERDRHVSRRLDRAFRLPLLPLPDGGRHVLPLVYAGNVATGIVGALERPEAAGRAYNLTRDNDSPLHDVVRAWRAARGERVPAILPVPAAIIDAAARGVDLLSRALPGLDLPGMRRPARLVREDNPYDSTRAAVELGWRDLVPLDEAVRRTVAWLDAARADRRGTGS